MKQVINPHSLTISGKGSQIKSVLNEITKSQIQNCTLAQFTQKALQPKPSLGNG